MLRSARYLEKKVGSLKRDTTFHNLLNKSDKNDRESVCRIFFLKTLALKPDFVYNTVRSVTNTGTLELSHQGTHGNQRKIDQTIVQGIRNHINSFQVVDSHYCR
ncbi:elongation factor 4 [Elysia marginata]|uniref:Elongation factor 4 n=1 Tax=Elysia marginata TaxID=1093978 RepID=A0AAV4EJ85_9GAST|nr:elongation factor 4 [Elysia marginata]